MTLFRGVEIQHSIIGRKMALGVAGSNSISKLLNRTGRQMLRRALSGSEYIGHPWDHWAVIEVVTDLAMNKIRNPIWVSINMYTHFARLHFDSLDMAKLRKALEERFDIRIGESEQFKTVGDAQDTVRKCLAARDQHLLATRMQQIGDTYQSVVEVIKDVLELSKQEIEKVNDRSSLMQDLGADSDALAEVVAAIMDKYEIDIPHEVGENFRTIGDIVEYLNMRAEGVGSFRERCYPAAAADVIAARSALIRMTEEQIFERLKQVIVRKFSLFPEKMVSRDTRLERFFEGGLNEEEALSKELIRDALDEFGAFDPEYFEPELQSVISGVETVGHLVTVISGYQKWLKNNQNKA